MQKQGWQWRQMQITPTTLLGGVLSTGVIGTAVLWLWAKQHPTSSELSIITLVITLIFWSNIAQAVLKSFRLMVLCREYDSYSYELDIFFALFVFMLLFTTLLVLITLFVFIFPIGGNNLLLFMFLMMFLVLKMHEIIIESATYHVNHY